MTSDKRSQEAEDVALLELMRVHEDQTVCNCEPGQDYTCRFCQDTRSGFRPILARLVREGQIREAEDARKQVLLEGRSVAECLRLLAARIAALKQEG